MGDGASDGVPAGLGTSVRTDTRCTQVRGPREEVKPLLLHDLVYTVEFISGVTVSLLELYMRMWAAGKNRPARAGRPAEWRSGAWPAAQGVSGV